MAAEISRERPLGNHPSAGCGTGCDMNRRDVRHPPHLSAMADCEQLENNARNPANAARNPIRPSPLPSTRSKVPIRDKTRHQALVHLVPPVKNHPAHPQPIACQPLEKLRNRFTRSLHKLFTSVRPNSTLAGNPFKQPDLTTLALRAHCEQPGNSHRESPQRTVRERSDPPRGADPPTRKRRIAPIVFATIRNAAKISPNTATKAKTTSPRTTHSGHQRRSSRSTLPRTDFQAGSGS